MIICIKLFCVKSLIIFLPLNSGGDASEMYIGTDIEAKPIPAPTTTRPISRISLVTDMPIITDPTAKMTLKYFCKEKIT